VRKRYENLAGFLLEGPHLLLDGRVPTIVAVLIDKTVEEAFGCVALLLRCLSIRDQDLID
jgi:hypothetical protein